MSQNLGSLDKILRIAIGFALIAFAFQNGTKIEGWHWVGLIGIVPIVTVLMGTCPLYSVLGVSSCSK